LRVLTNSLILGMPLTTQIPVKCYPFARLLTALIAGIIVEWYLDLELKAILGFSIILLCLAFLSASLSVFKKFSSAWARGLIVLLIFVCTGMATTWQQNALHSSEWYGKTYSSNDELLATIKEPFVEKSDSYKALAEINAVFANGQWCSATGSILVYLQKGFSKSALEYGSQIIFNKSLQPIKNSGNPATFDYTRYCLFQGITAQVFLSNNDYYIMSAKNTKTFQKLLFNLRNQALQVLKENILSEKELGIAEALLIGYRNDLDKEVERVINKMPLWKPGKQNGSAVAVYFNLPVTFVNTEEE